MLDTLNNVLNTSCVSNSNNPINDNKRDKEDENEMMLISIQLSEMFLKDTTNLEILLDLLDEYEFNTRWSSVKLLDALVGVNNVVAAMRVQELVLKIPRGVSRLVDLLNESREVIRNDAIQLLKHLTQQTPANLANIQKVFLSDLSHSVRLRFESNLIKIKQKIE